jgi:L-alanine-DL-glutamate epimerase-like enolase superfamily enzyme
MLKITRVNSNLLSVPTGKLITDSIHSLKHVEVVTCKVKTSDGIVGFGFTYTIGTGGFAIKSVIDSMFQKVLVGKDPGHIQEIWEEMWESTHAVGRGGITTHAMAAVDIALWDIKGKTLEKPLYKLLRGSNKGIPLYDTNSGWLHYSEKELVFSALQVLKEGFRGFKIKVGRKTLKEDVDRIKAVANALDNRIPLMIDANQVWDKEEALKRGKAFDKLGVFWYEEPLVAEDIWGHSELAKALSVPIAVGETIFTKQEFENYARLGAVDILQPDVCRVGGITEWMDVAKIAEAHGLKVSPHFVMDLHPSLMASIPNGRFVEYIPWLRKLFREPPKVDNGMIFPSVKPGIGLELEPSAFQRYVVE